MNSLLAAKLRYYLLSIIALLSHLLAVQAAAGARKGAPLLDVRIYTPGEADRGQLSELGIQFENHATAPFVDALLSGEKLTALRKSGLAVTVLSNAHVNRALPPTCKSFSEVEDDIFALQRRFPDIVHIEQIGSSTTLGVPIWAVKVSDHAAVDENEPTILFQALHHARELIGVHVCLALLEDICEKYGRDRDVTRWVDSIEIWVVPVMNPDGYKYMFETEVRFPWWRKNLRDNDGDGRFDPLVDGVDLNRNYGYNWQEGGDGKPGSWFYRGAHAFSESETRAIQRLALRENFAMGVSYHSYGESVLYPWGNFDRPPDIELIVDIAHNLARRIQRVSGRGTYIILPLDGRVGQSSIWFYGALRTIDFIVEVGTEHIPKPHVIPTILTQQLRGVYYLLERLLQSGVKGVVYDRETGAPLVAEIVIREFRADYVRPRRTDSRYGSFYVVLNPGRYTLEVRSEGYAPRVLRKVRVKENGVVDLTIGLERLSGERNTW